MMTLRCFSHDVPFSLAVDTGASVSLLSERAFSALQSKLPHVPLSLVPSALTLSGVQGLTLTVLGTVTLPVTLAPNVETFSITFYVIKEFKMPCDGLLGQDSLAAHGIDVFPSRNAISWSNCFFPTMTDSVPLLTVSAVDASTVTLDSGTPPSPVEGKRSPSAPRRIAAVVIGDQYIGPSSAASIPVRLSDAAVGSDVLSVPDSMKVSRLSLESTLSSVDAHNMTHALVSNASGAPINLKKGVCLGHFEVFESSSLEESSPFPVASVSAQPRDEDLSDVVAQLAPHVKSPDYPDGKPALLKLLAQHRQAVALPGEPLGLTDRVTHTITLQPDAKPSYVPSYRLPHSQRLVMQQKVDELLAAGVIQESHSPWNSPMFLVGKKDGSYRPVIDFRKVNALTVPDHYPLPVLSDLLQSLGSSNTVFSSIDLLSGFWQIPLDAKSREITAFSTPFGHYEWLRLPMGLRNAPLTFQRMVNSLFAGVIGNGLFVYLDDLIVVSKDMASHFRNLDLVFSRLREAGLKAKLSKCNFLKSRIEFLGHVVDGDGIHTVDSKIKAVKHFPTPKTVENVRSFLGLAGYYRAFVRNFASIASPLTRLLKKDTPFIWHDAQKTSFETLKKALTHTPILAFPDYTQPFTLCTDASALGVGAVLMQSFEGPRPRVIAYASRVLNSAESKYSVTHLEALAVVWALQHFRDLIFGYKVTVYTDHSAVTQLFSGKNLSGRLARWYLTIMQFEPQIKYLPGRANTVADALSRNIPVAAVTQVDNFSLPELRTAQRSDPLWSCVVYALESGDDSALPKLPVPFVQFSLQDDVLCRTVTVSDAVVTQLVIPSAFVDVVLKLLHDTPLAGHPGRDKTLAAARGKYYWPTMRIDIENHISRCLSCAQTKGTTTTAPILEYPLPAGPFDVVGLDLLQLPRSIQGSGYILVCVDHFSRFVVLAPLRDKSAVSVAHALVSHLICPYTTPRVLLTDNGTEFKNQVLADICSQYGVKQTFITAHHPASNGLVERTNRKILEILRHLSGQLHETWEDWLPQVAASINSSVNSSTGKTPYYIVFGCDKKLPYDVLLQPPSPLYNPEDYSRLQLHSFQTIHASVRERLKASREEMLRKQHLLATPVTFDVGDTVMIRVPERSCKLLPKFKGPYVISAKLHGNKFKVIDPDTSTSEVVHADRLKRVHSALSPTAEPFIPLSSDPSSDSPVTPSSSDLYRQKLRSACRV